MIIETYTDATGIERVKSVKMGAGQKKDKNNENNILAAATRSGHSGVGITPSWNNSGRVGGECWFSYDEVDKWAAGLLVLSAQLRQEEA